MCKVTGRATGVAHEGGEFGDEVRRLCAGAPSAVRRVWTFSGAAAERLAGATGLRVALAA